MASLQAAALLADPVRRALYDAVVDSDGPVSREQAAERAGTTRALAGYHLDQLVEAGLLTTSFARTGARTGPGSGRPAKHYARTEVAVAVQLPPREDAALARLLAAAVESDRTGAARAALRRVTRKAGRDLAKEHAPATTEELVAVLEQRGYAPQVEQDGGIRLRNCPFHHLVADHLDLVCGLNEDLLGSAVAAADLDLRAVLDPAEGRCCVVLRRA
jgi:predicted ArsR family transcriptional regulator